MAQQRTRPRRAGAEPKRGEQEESAPKPLAMKLLAEGVGTFFATLIPTSVDVAYYTGHTVDDVSRWLARGFGTTALIYAFSTISGAHVDPAVTLGFLIRRDLRLPHLLAYWGAQFAGAFAAAGLGFALWGPRIGLGASRPGPQYAPFEAFVAEIVLTAFLMVVILGTAEQEATVGKQAALAVGLTVATCGFIGGTISGASMNPARSIAPQLLGGLDGIVWIYASGPLIGAAAGALLSDAIFGRPTAGERKAGRGD